MSPFSWYEAPRMSHASPSVGSIATERSPASIASAILRCSSAVRDFFSSSFGSPVTSSGAATAAGASSVVAGAGLGDGERLGPRARETGAAVPVPGGFALQDRWRRRGGHDRLGNGLGRLDLGSSWTAATVGGGGFAGPWSNRGAHRALRGRRWPRRRRRSSRSPRASRDAARCAATACGAPSPE